MHKPHYCTPVPDITNECIHGFEERKRLRRHYHSAYYELLRPAPFPQPRKGGVRLMVAPEVMERALDRMAQPPTILWGIRADTFKQGVAYLTDMYRRVNVTIRPDEIRRVTVKGRRKRHPGLFAR